MNCKDQEDEFVQNKSLTQ